LGPDGEKGVIIEKNKTLLEGGRFSGIHINNLYGRQGIF
jgi:hypothetical protein